jgi:hypothetical protein
MCSGKWGSRERLGVAAVCVFACVRVCFRCSCRWARAVPNRPADQPSGRRRATARAAPHHGVRRRNLTAHVRVRGQQDARARATMLRLTVLEGAVSRVCVCARQHRPSVIVVRLMRVARKSCCLQVGARGDAGRAPLAAWRRAWRCIHASIVGRQGSSLLLFELRVCVCAECACVLSVDRHRSGSVRGRGRAGYLRVCRVPPCVAGALGERLPRAPSPGGGRCRTRRVCWLGFSHSIPSELLGCAELCGGACGANGGAWRMASQRRRAAATAGARIAPRLCIAGKLARFCRVVKTWCGVSVSEFGGGGTSQSAVGFCRAVTEPVGGAYKSAVVAWLMTVSLGWWMRVCVVAKICAGRWLLPLVLPACVRA